MKVKSVHFNGFNFLFNYYNIRTSSFHKLETLNFSISNWLSFLIIKSIGYFCLLSWTLFLPINVTKWWKVNSYICMAHDINIYHPLVKFINKLFCTCSHSKLLQPPTKLPPIIFVALLWITLTDPCLSCAEGSRAGCSSLGGVSPECSRGAESPPLFCWPCFFWCSPGYGWASGLRSHIIGSCQAFLPPVSPSPSPQGCS